MVFGCSRGLRLDGLYWLIAVVHLDLNSQPASDLLCLAQSNREDLVSGDQ